VGKARRLCGNAFEDVVYETVHDAHGLAGDTSVGMDLLQYFVNVDCVAFFPLALLLLIALGDILLSFASLLGGFTGGLRWHDDSSKYLYVSERESTLKKKFSDYYSWQGPAVSPPSCRVRLLGETRAPVSAHYTVSTPYLATGPLSRL